MNPEILVILLVAIPLFCGFLFSIFSKKAVIAKILSVISACLILVISILLFKTELRISVGGWKPPLGISISYDGFTAIMIVIVAFISLSSIIYSLGYMKRYTSQAKYYALFFLMLAGMNGVLITGDIFNMYVFIEIASIASYVLVGFGVENEELEASFKYIVQGSIGSAFIFVGIAVMYATFGTLNMADIALKMKALNVKGASVYLSLAFFLMGFSLKAALFPFHAWLPDAHPSAPAPISAMLSGLLVKAIGIYSIMRITFSAYGFNESIQNIFLILGSLSMIIGVLLALGQWDYKRLCAYHSVSQLGYIMIAFGVATPLGIAAGIFHLLNHSVFKSLLFLNAGAVEYVTGTRDLRKLGGIKSAMPIAGSTSMIASLSISGIPPFNGFFSKVMIIFACIAAGHWLYGILAIIGSILTLASFLKVQKFAFFGKLILKDIKDAPFSMNFTMIMLAIMCLLMSVLVLPEVKDFVFNGAVKAIIP